MHKKCHATESIYISNLAILVSRSSPDRKLSSGYSEKQIRIDDVFHSHRIDEDIVIRTRCEF